MSKMGISTVSSYCGAQVFEAVGLDTRLVQRYFAGTPGTIGGVGLAEIHAEVAARHARAYPANAAERAHRRLEVGGEYQWRREGELHLFNPETVFLLQHATRSRQYDVFRAYTSTVDGLAGEAGSLRGLFRFRAGDRGRSRSTRSSRSARSSSASPPARCPTARSPPRRTRPSRSR